MLKGIIIAGAGSAALDVASASSIFPRTKQATLASIEILGATVIDRVIEDFKSSGVHSVEVIADASPETEDSSDVSGGSWQTAGRKLLDCANDGIEAVLLMRVGPYVELDIPAALQAHRDSGEPVVRAFSGRSPLDIWIVDPASMLDPGSKGNAVVSWLTSAKAARYEVSGYVNKLESPRDLRNLAVDTLNLRCRMRPLGLEVRPGVWMAEGAEVEKDARIVAPAYIGRQAVVSQQCLVTRGSNIECKSLIDYGTVIEDTSVLPNSYVGIGLDVSHSIVDGDKLLNLQHGVVVTIEDSAVMRQNKPLGEAACRWWGGFENVPALSIADKGAN